MSKRVGIVQSSYIPWKGYFDLINSVDEFIIYDDVQFTQRDWRNRNRIKTAQGPLWLTIPVSSVAGSRRPIRDMRVSTTDWAARHWASISRSYARAPHFAEVRDWLASLYAGATLTSLSEVNYRFLAAVCERLGIRTRLSWSMDYRLDGDPTGRLVSLCQQAGATEYLSGPSARAYVDAAQFEKAGIVLRYFDYGGYPSYPQLHGSFAHQVSIIDLIVHTGSGASRFMKSFPDAAAE